MPVLKVKKDNGAWQDIATANSHAHTVSDISDLPASLVDDVEALKDKVGAESVAYQITTAIQTNEYVHPYTHPVSMITGLADVAISGSYEDLTDVPEEYVHPESHDASMITGLADVATSGSYNDLSDKPTIPSITGLATKTYVDAQITNISSSIPEEYVHPESHPASMITGLASVATSGSYTDLSDKPSIPSIVGLATKTYVDEQIASISGSGGTGEQVQADWDETDETSPAYIKNKPTISGDGGASVQANWEQSDSTQADYIKNKPFGDFGTALTEFMPETNLPFNYNETDGGYSFNMTPPSDYIKTWNDDWTEAEVVWDGTTYACQAQYLQGIKVVGNLGLMMGGETTGEPFVMMMADAATVGADMCSIISLADEIPEDPSTAETKHHDLSMSIYQKNIVKLPLKYSHRPDWNESDSSNGSYIANRPFFTMSSGTVVVPETTVSCDTLAGGDIYYTMIDPINNIGAYNYQIDFDGVVYNITAQVAADGVSCYFVYDDGTVMFQIDPSGILVSTQGSHTFKITLLEDAVFKIDEKYLPEIKALPEVTTDDNEKILSVVDGAWAAAEHDWNTLKNRPFYEENYSASFSFETAESVPTTKFSIDSLTAYKIADFALSSEYLLQSAVTLTVDDNDAVTVQITEDRMMASDDFILVQIDSGIGICVAHKTGSQSFSGVTFNVPKVGTYFILPSSYTTPAPISGDFVCSYIKTLDAKYLPKHLHFGEGETILTEFLPSITLPFTYSEADASYVFEITPSSEQLATWNDDWTEAEVVWDGTTYACQAQYVQGVKALGNVGAMMGGADTGEPFIIMAADAATMGEEEDVCMIYSLTDEIPEDVSTAETKYHDVAINISKRSVVKVPLKYLYQPDWNENDETSGNYIANRPFSEIPAGTCIFKQNVITGVNISAPSEGGTIIGMAGTSSLKSQYIIDGATYNVEIGDVTYTGVGFYSYDATNERREIVATDDTGNGVCRIVNNYFGYDGFFNNTEYLPNGSSYDVKVTLAEDAVQKIDAKYLPKISSLPEVTTDDNDKVLKVVDGAWAIASSLPNVTTSDAGKFLRVGSDGTWVVEAIQDVSEVGL